ncbi:hypothetical protein A2U01_0067217 [Trifolium medium]|uniref:Uncharacterized protein n=1 Tax=Trifolium medium TaxID=97028 RepID=A0A392SC18_9FABA|nr:hypothetical protein [Trifolium medium]
MTWAVADPSLDGCMYHEGVYSTGKPNGGYVAFGDERFADGFDPTAATFSATT